MMNGTVKAILEDTKMILKRPVVALLLCLLSLTAMAQERAGGVAWDDLPQDLQGILGPMQSQWDSLPSQRQERLRNGARRWQSLSPDERGLVQQQFRGWMQRSPEQRERIRNRFERFRDLPPERQDELRQRFEENRERRDARISNQSPRPGARPGSRQAPARTSQSRPQTPAPSR